MQLLTKEIKAKLIKNHQKQAIASLKDKYIEFKPVVKYFGGSSCTWLITEMLDDDDTLFALCDLGLGCPELGYVSLRELESLKFPPFGLGVERDLYFTASKTLSQYHNEAIEAHRIIA